jgi:hypothetical protein
LIQNLTKYACGTYDRASDPVAGIDLNGNIYLNTIAANVGSPADILISKSTDGGSTFGNPSLVYRPPTGSGISADKNWLAINTFSGTSHPNRLLVVLQTATSTSQPIVRSYSDDGGANWFPADYVSSSSAVCDGAIPVYLANGNAAVAYLKRDASWPTNFLLELALSTDGGMSFPTRYLIANPLLYQPSGIRNQNGKPALAADRTNPGNLYLTYQSLSNNSPKIFVVKSTNSGANWGTPIMVSDNPSGSPVFNPAIAVSPDGNVVTIVFYDMRNDPNRNRYVDLYMAQSTNGGMTWPSNTKVSSISSDVTLAPNTDGLYMLGDYLAVAPSGAVGSNVPAIAIWSDTRNGNPDPFVAKVGVNLTSGAVVSQTLVNADNGSDIQQLNNGTTTTLNLATLPTQHLNIRANADGAPVGSVVLSLSGTQARTQTENNAPYALFGDDGHGVYSPWTPAVGSYSLTSTPWSLSGGTGARGTSLTNNFTVVNQASTPRVVSYTLVNADSDLDLQILSNCAILNLSTLPTRNLTIRANTSPATVGSVVFALSGAQTSGRTENGAPYALFGDNGQGDYYPWAPQIQPGSYTLKATPYSGSNGGGTMGNFLTINFSVVNQ